MSSKLDTTRLKKISKHPYHDEGKKEFFETIRFFSFERKLTEIYFI